jgi:hypothetical protein
VCIHTRWIQTLIQFHSAVQRLRIAFEFHFPFDKEALVLRATLNSSVPTNRPF